MSYIEKKYQELTSDYHKGSLISFRCAAIPFPGNVAKHHVSSKQANHNHLRSVCSTADWIKDSFV